MDENLQRILEELNRLLGEWRQELSASDRARMEWLRNTIQEATKIVNDPAQTLESQEASAADISRDQAELDDLAQEALGGKPDYTFPDAEKVVAQLAAEMVPLFTSGIAEDNTVMATNFVLTYLFGDPIPIGGPSDWADMAGVLANAADRLTLFPTHLTREDHLRAIISGLRSDNKITANQFDALMLNRSSHRYANIPEADRLWAQWYLPQLVESLPRFMTEAVDQASTPQIAAGANVNVPSDFQPVNFGRLVISMVDEISAKDFAAGNSVVPPTQPPEPENVDLRDAFGRGPTGGEAKLEDAVKDVLRVQGHLVEEAQIDDSDTAKGTTEAIKQFVAELKSKRARWRSEGFDEDQIADALFRTAEQFAKRGVVAEGQRIVDGAVPEEEPLPTLSPFEESVRNEAAKLSRTLEGSEAERDLFLANKGKSKDSFRQEDLDRMALAIREDGGLSNALKAEILEAIPGMQRLKSNEDMRKSQKILEDAVRDAGFPEERIKGVAGQLKIQLRLNPYLDAQGYLEQLYRVGGEAGRPTPLTLEEAQFLGVPPVVPESRADIPTAGTLDPDVAASRISGEELGQRREFFTDPAESARIEAERQAREARIAEREGRTVDGVLDDEDDDPFRGLPVDTTTPRPFSRAEVEKAFPQFSSRPLNGQTPLTQAQAIELGFPAERGFTEQDKEDILGSIPPGPLTDNQKRRLFETGQFVTLEDAERRFSQLGPPGSPQFPSPARVGAPGDLTREQRESLGFPAVNGLADRDILKNPFPAFNVLRPIEDMVDFGFPTTEVGRAALGTDIGKLALRGSEDNAYFQQFLLDQIPGLVPAFKESGIQAAKDRETKARETATALQKQGDFTADQTSRFILQRRGQKDKMDFLKFAEKEIPRLRGEFRLTPAFTERRQRKALAAEQETERETERLDREKNQRRQRALRSRGRTVVTRA